MPFSILHDGRGPKRLRKLEYPPTPYGNPCSKWFRIFRRRAFFSQSPVTLCVQGWVVSWGIPVCSLPDFSKFMKKHVVLSSKTLILSISGPRDLLETIPRAISDRMVRVPSDFVSSRAILGQNKVPRTLSMPGPFLTLWCFQKTTGKHSGAPSVF